MDRLRSFNTPCLFIFVAIVCTGVIGCGNDSSTGPDEIGLQQETFPGLLQEEWFFFNPDRTFHHFEIFTYQYDADGRRIRGDFFHSETGVSLVLTYEYDSDGRLITEHWEGPEIPDVGTLFWDLTYRYNENKTRILGGVGTGFYDWEFVYDHDSEGRRSTTTFSSDDPLAPRFTLYHQYDDQGQCILATGTEQRGLSIVIVYTYEQTDAAKTLAVLEKVMGSQCSTSISEALMVSSR